MLSWLLATALASESPSHEALLVDELDRVSRALAEREDRPYYIALALQDRVGWSLMAREGALGVWKPAARRALDVDLRVGTPELDSTHQMRGFSGLDGTSRERVMLPYEDGAEQAIRHAVWRTVDRHYRDAAERIVMVRAERDVKVAEESQAPDFELRTPAVHREDARALVFDPEPWRDVLIELSDALEEHPEVERSTVRLDVNRDETTFVDTEGARLRHGRIHARFSMQVANTHADGSEISVFDSIDVHDPSSLPSVDELRVWAGELTQHLDELQDAPRGEPYSGPVLLRGRAAGVFFHEVFGHRVEGHRQKSEFEGKTFVEYVGKKLLPEFIDVYDDPTLARLADTDLNGHYAYDDEGVAAARAELVEDGVFVGFLMSRSPIPGFDHSNGHGRRMVGMAPVARMGNTIIEASETQSWDALREQLVAMVKEQGLPYGYIVDDISGGFTMTGRVTPNAFNVRANTTWRVFADGRPDQLVRGIDLVGTPLAAFSSLRAAGDEPEVFNGTCGAESGWVPVSAVSPPLLFERMEFQLKEKGQERPPLLPKPARDDGAADGGAP